MCSVLIGVTGSSGFIGRRLVASLHSQGHKVRGLDLVEGQMLETSETPDEMLVGDLAGLGVATAFVQGLDLVVHSAAAVPLAKNNKAFVHSNVEATRALVAARPKRLVHISSSAVYGVPKQLPVRRDTPTAPIEPYGWSKLAAEQCLPRDAIVIRPRTVIGPGRGGLFSLLFDLIRGGRPVPVLGRDTTIQLVDVDDFCSAVNLLLEEAPGVYNVGVPEYETLAGDLRYLIEEVGSRSRVVVFPGLFGTLAGAACSVNLLPFAPWHTKTYGHSNFVDVDDLVELGWKPEMPSNRDVLLNAYRTSLTNDEGSSPHTKTLSSRLLQGTRR